MDDLSKALREVTMFPFNSAVCTFIFLLAAAYHLLSSVFQ
jgi:hypothetical protein